jgi:HupE / UreJ protein
MKTKFAFALCSFLVIRAPAIAHRLDEYLQATILSVNKTRLQASMRLLPGIAVFPAVFASIDTNSDGVLSESEQRSYAARVLADLSLTADGHPLRPQSISVHFPSIELLKAGLGEIQIEFRADLPAGGSHRRIILENHHQRRISVYLVNCLVPQDRDIHVVGQQRNENQSLYQVEYVNAAAGSDPSLAWYSRFRTALGNLGGFPGVFRLGMQHIAEGSDHILFLLTMLLPAPLIAFGSRWGAYAGVRHSLAQILRVVTAFTVGHSFTLALAAFQLVHMSSRPIEVLIAISILVSASHALRPLFPGREAAIAAFFGLIHGLAFAATLEQLGLSRWERIVSLLGFNLGIEAMQLMIVAAAMPSLLLLSRTRAYSYLRIGGALFAGLASAGWIAERLFAVHNPVDLVVNSAAQFAPSIAAFLLLISLICWSRRGISLSNVPDHE